MNSKILIIGLLFILNNAYANHCNQESWRQAQLVQSDMVKSQRALQLLERDFNEKFSFFEDRLDDEAGFAILKAIEHQATEVILTSREALVNWENLAFSCSGRNQRVADNYLSKIRERLNITNSKDHILYCGTNSSIERCKLVFLERSINDEKVKFFENLINQEGLDTDFINERTGLSLLSRAIKDNQNKIVQKLIELGADINIRTVTGEGNETSVELTPVQFAARKGNIEAIELLVNAGADLTLITEWGNEELNFSDFAIDMARSSSLGLEGSLNTEKAIKLLELAYSHGPTPRHYSQDNVKVIQSRLLNKLRAPLSINTRKMNLNEAHEFLQQNLLGLRSFTPFDQSLSTYEVVGYHHNNSCSFGLVVEVTQGRRYGRPRSFFKTFVVDLSNIRHVSYEEQSYSSDSQFKSLKLRISGKNIYTGSLGSRFYQDLSSIDLEMIDRLSTRSVSSESLPLSQSQYKTNYLNIDNAIKRLRRLCR